MSFNTLKKPELVAVVKEFVGPDAAEGTTQELLAVLADEGVTWEMYTKAKEAAEKAKEEEGQDTPDQTPAAPVATESAENRFKEGERMCLVKMTRHNFTYQVRGYTFTKEHPFVLMPESTAQEIFDSVEGFVVATPREAAEYYS